MLGNPQGTYKRNIEKMPDAWFRTRHQMPVKSLQAAIKKTGLGSLEVQVKFRDSFGHFTSFQLLGTCLLFAFSGEVRGVLAALDLQPALWETGLVT